MREKYNFTNCSQEDAESQLDGFKELKTMKEFEKLKPGDNVKYATNLTLKGGGVLKANKCPNFLVLRNNFKNISWCVQLVDPTLRLWIKEDKDSKLNAKKDKVFESYQKGLLVKKNKNYDEMVNIYKLFKDGKIKKLE